jgi:1,3-beta-glucanosyltransferase GAS1
MMNLLRVLLSAALLFLTAGVRADVDPIVIKVGIFSFRRPPYYRLLTFQKQGSHFFYKTNGTEFFIKGVAYQQDITDITAESAGVFIDALADASSCDRDIPALQQLGINLVHVYAVDNTKPKVAHDECMNLFAAAGIYVIVDLTTSSTFISRTNPSWNLDLYNSYTATIDSMAGYSNLLGFFAGNGVANGSSTTSSAAAVKGAVRDMKAYIKSKNYRPIGVGYAADNDAEIMTDISAYFNCGDDADSIDFFGLNDFSWCGNSSYTESGYSEITAQFQNYSVPVFFSEYGCKSATTRTFTEVKAIYGSQMTDTFSGGIAYQYFQDAADFGNNTVFQIHILLC